MRFTLFILATSIFVALLSGCLQREPIPARPAAQPFGPIGDIELIAHRDGTRLDRQGDPLDQRAASTPGAEAAPPAWGTDPTDGATADSSPSVGIPDSRLRLLVRRSLADADVDMRGVEVHIANGRVTLTGTVDSRMRRDRIEIAARSVDSATEIINQINIDK